ncbi:unnamed protein product [Protopolystoma xenopodis]|uniref:Uncharacterized protein n=1 Tax=Protopolystoma xenopodis TaxID=117903 RepID=A0A448XKS2_9PLAT|nr:unnamed protein product [Protopolystoma xenopodis]
MSVSLSQSSFSFVWSLPGLKIRNYTTLKEHICVLFYSNFGPSSVTSSYRKFYVLTCAFRLYCQSRMRRLEDEKEDWCLKHALLSFSQHFPANVDATLQQMRFCGSTNSKEIASLCSI